MLFIVEGIVINSIYIAVVVTVNHSFLSPKLQYILGFCCNGDDMTREAAVAEVNNVGNITELCLTRVII